jgi:hypothetical protein
MVEFHPRFAAAVIGEHGELNRQRQPMHAHGNGEDVLRAAPIETLGNDFFTPAMLAVQALGGGKGIKLPPRRDFSEELDADNLRPRQVRRDLIEARLRLGRYRLALLMEQRGEEKKLPMLDAKTIASFTDTAFAQDEDLFSVSQRIDDDGPFFESRPHKDSLGEQPAFDNAPLFRANAEGLCPVFVQPAVLPKLDRPELAWKL